MGINQNLPFCRVRETRRYSQEVTVVIKDLKNKICKRFFFALGSMMIMSPL